MKATMEIKPGSKVECSNVLYEITHIIDMESVIVKNPTNGEIKRLFIKDLLLPANKTDEEQPGAGYPLSVVQIDHTKLDIILVDDIDRLPIGRPWLTLAIDVYGRMIAGMSASLDPPGAMSAGLCLSHAILPNEQ